MQARATSRQSRADALRQGLPVNGGRLLEIRAPLFKIGLAVCKNEVRPGCYIDERSNCRGASVMDGNSDYGGECDVIIQSSGQLSGRFWIDIEFNGRRLPQSNAVLSVSRRVGVRLKEAGLLLFDLDDGRKLHGTISVVLATESVIALTRIA